MPMQREFAVHVRVPLTVLMRALCLSPLTTHTTKLIKKRKKKEGLRTPLSPFVRPDAFSALSLLIRTPAAAAVFPDTSCRIPTTE